jgi:hypothetical protein
MLEEKRGPLSGLWEHKGPGVIQNEIQFTYIAGFLWFYN